MGCAVKKFMNHAKTILVTGGAQGIGLGIAQHFLNAGANVAVLDVNVAALAELPKNILALPCDISQETEVQNAILKTIAKFGQLHGLVNNAGLANAHNGPIEDLSLTHWNKVLATNLTGPMLCSKHAAPHLRATRGAIINIASTRALQSEAHSESYAASKGGLLALTHALAISLGPDVRVNCISAGWIETQEQAKHSDADKAQHPVGRVGAPHDIAALVEFLCFGDSGFITGQNFVVDGGMTKKMIYLDA